MDIVLQTNT